MILNRLKWLLLVPAFTLADRILLHLYWLPDRRAWISRHPSLSPAYGDGRVDAQAIIATAAPAVIALLCLVSLRAPRLWLVIVIGVISALVGFGLQHLCSAALANTFGFRLARHLPIAIGTLFVISACMLVSRRKGFRDSRANSNHAMQRTAGRAAS